MLILVGPIGVTGVWVRKMLVLARGLYLQHLEARRAEADLLGRIESFELAYRMQSEAPEAVNEIDVTVEVRVEWLRAGMVPARISQRLALPAPDKASKKRSHVLT